MAFCTRTHACTYLMILITTYYKIGKGIIYNNLEKNLMLQGKFKDSYKWKC